MFWVLKKSDGCGKDYTVVICLTLFLSFVFLSSLTQFFFVLIHFYKFQTWLMPFSGYYYLFNQINANIYSSSTYWNRMSEIIRHVVRQSNVCSYSFSVLFIWTPASLRLIYCFIVCRINRISRKFRCSLNKHPSKLGKNK